MTSNKITIWALISRVRIVTGLSWIGYARGACGHPSTSGTLASDQHGGTGVGVRRALAPDSLKG